MDLAHEHIIIDPFLISAWLSVWSKWTNWDNLFAAWCFKPSLRKPHGGVRSSAWNQSVLSDDGSYEENQGCLRLNLEQATMFFSEAALTGQVPTIYQSHHKEMPNGIRNRKHFRKQQSICLHTFNLSNSCRCIHKTLELPAACDLWWEPGPPRLTTDAPWVHLSVPIPTYCSYVS